MKKWSILIIVVLGAVILAVQYVIEKKTGIVQEQKTAPVVESPVGVALPEGASAPEPMPAATYSAPAGEGTVYGPILLPGIKPIYKGACPGSSLPEMLETHDKYWGFFAWNTSFTQEETQKMYNYLADYVGCQAAARTDFNLCGYLPAVAEKKGKRVPRELMPYTVCRDKILSVLSEGYRAGVVKDDLSCRAISVTWNKERVSKLSVPELCSNLGKGTPAAISYLRGIFPAPEALPVIKASFPENEGECAKEPDCLRRYGLYKSAKTGNPEYCPKGYTAYCQALTERSAIPCDKTLQEMSKFYCATVARVKKSTGGYIGMTKEEIRADLDNIKAAKDEADKVKKIQEKEQAEVNKRVRKLLKKDEAEPK